MPLYRHLVCVCVYWNVAMAVEINKLGVAASVAWAEDCLTGRPVAGGRE